MDVRLWMLDVWHVGCCQISNARTLISLFAMFLVFWLLRLFNSLCFVMRMWGCKPNNNNNNNNDKTRSQLRALLVPVPPQWPISGKKFSACVQVVNCIAITIASKPQKNVVAKLLPLKVFDNRLYDYYDDDDDDDDNSDYIASYARILYSFITRNGFKRFDCKMYPRCISFRCISYYI